MLSFILGSFVLDFFFLCILNLISCIPIKRIYIFYCLQLEEELLAYQTLFRQLKKNK